MKYDVVVDPEAENDLALAISWYEKQSAGLGNAFETSVDAALEQIRRNPELCGKVVHDLRRKSIRKYPFASST